MLYGNDDLRIEVTSEPDKLSIRSSDYHLNINISDLDTSGSLPGIRPLNRSNLRDLGTTMDICAKHIQEPQKATSIRELGATLKRIAAERK